mgnify:CR=1 FL=1
MYWFEEAVAFDAGVITIDGVPDRIGVIEFVHTSTVENSRAPTPPLASFVHYLLYALMV